MLMKLAIPLGFLLACGLYGQTTPLAFTGAHIIPIAGNEIDNGVLVVQDGKIVAVGPASSGGSPSGLRRTRTLAAPCSRRATCTYLRRCGNRRLRRGRSASDRGRSRVPRNPRSSGSCPGSNDSGGGSCRASRDHSPRRCGTRFCGTRRSHRRDLRTPRNTRPPGSARTRGCPEARGVAP